MSDLIERDAAIRMLCDYAETQQDLDYYSDMLIKIPAVNRWIPCSERLPEPLQNVLVCTNINTVTVAWINGNDWTFADTGNGHVENWTFDDVKYWMSLPEPPEKWCSRMTIGS